MRFCKRPLRARVYDGVQGVLQMRDTTLTNQDNVYNVIAKKLIEYRRLRIDLVLSIVYRYDGRPTRRNHLQIGGVL